MPTVFSTRDEAFNAAAMRPIVKLYSMGHLLRFEPLIDSTIAFFLAQLDARFACPSPSSSGLDDDENGSKPCDMGNWLHYLAWDIIAEITFSSRMGFLASGADVQGALAAGDGAFEYLSVVGMMPWLDGLLDKNPVFRLGPPAFVPVANFALARIAARRSSSSSSRDDTDEKKGAAAVSTTANGKDASKRPPDFLDAFLSIQAADPENVSDDVLLSWAMINVAAGSDTVAAELRSVVYHLCRHPRKMVRLRAELDAALGPPPPSAVAKKSGGEEAKSGSEPETKAELVPVLSWSEAQNLPYLSACVEEGIRLMPAVTLPLERVVVDPAGLRLPDGTVLPLGTRVGMNPWVVCRDRGVFGRDAGDFRPERWLRDERAGEGKGEEEDDFETRVGRMRAANLAFGAGTRACTGRNLALMELRKIVGSLVRGFEIELVEPKKEWWTRGGWFLRQRGMDVWVRRR